MVFCVMAHLGISQGCSDPGICTTGGLNSANTQDSVSAIDFTQASIEQLLSAHIAAERYRFGLEFAYMKGKMGTVLYNTIVRGDFRLRDKMALSFKLPYAYHVGDLGTVSAFGDLTLSLRNEIFSGRNRTLGFTLGVIIPTNNSNLMADGQLLPMDYQTSLGTFNALAGLSLKTKYVSLVLGYQQSFGQNGNEFAVENLTLDPTLPEYVEHNDIRQLYMTSRHIKRSGDLIMRLEGGYAFNKFALFGGILPIYRVKPSEVTLLSGEKVKVEGSDGLTINVTGGISYSFENNLSVTINCGTPLVQRKAMPDGLARDLVAIVGFSYKIW